MDKAAFLDFVIEVVRRIEGTAGFHVRPAVGLSSEPSDK